MSFDLLEGHIVFVGQSYFDSLEFVRLKFAAILENPF